MGKTAFGQRPPPLARTSEGKAPKAPSVVVSPQMLGAMHEGMHDNLPPPVARKGRRPF